MDNAFEQRMAPPRMSDGRHMTDYRPHGEVISTIRYFNNLYDSNQYRQFMINNATNMMAKNHEFYKNKNNVNTCGFIHPDPNGNDAFFEAYRKYMYGQTTLNINGKNYN